MKYKKINELCSTITSNLQINKLENNNGVYELYGASGLVKKIDFYKIDKPYISIVKDGAGVGRIDIHNAKSSIVGTLQAFVNNDNVNLKYLYYALKNQKLDKTKTGATIPHIYFKDYGNNLVKFYPLEEQQEIVLILDKINAIIDADKKQLELLDETVKSRFIEMFGDPMINDKNWESKPLGELCSIVRGGSPRPIEKFLGGNIPWIKIGDATDGDELYITKTAQYIIPEGLPKTRFIKAGSLIFANCGVSLGFCRILKIDGCIHDGWLAFQDISKSLNSIFLLSSINQTTQELRNSASGGTQPNLNTQIMSKYIQIVPPLYLQEKYVDFLLQIDKSKFNVQQHLNLMQELLDKKMEEFFGGAE